MTEEEKKYVDSLIANALSVATDESEGQQVIDLEGLNLCAVDYATTDVIDDAQAGGIISDGSLYESDTDILNSIYNDKDLMSLLMTPPQNLPDILDDIDTDNKVIIEFADATVKDPEPVTYEISVNPGDAINDDTIIGSVKQNGKMKKIKSIFSKGTVAGTNNNEEFLRLYPSKCARHIILENTLSGNGNDFDIQGDIMNVCDKFKNEGMLYSLITNNLCQSLLPFVLSRRYRGKYKLEQKALKHYWVLDSSDLDADNIEVSTFIKDAEYKDNKRYDTTLFVTDTENEKLGNGLAIFDTSIMKIVDEEQDEFGSSIIGSDITKEDMKNWKKRARKKRKRKKVKKEIKKKTEDSANKIKHDPNPLSAIQKEGDRLLDARKSYIQRIIEIYKNKESLPLCKYDPEYADCKFLINDEIDKNALSTAKKFDDEFSYSAIGDVDDYYNYYFSLLGNLNLLPGEQDPYTQEFFEIISDIIDKRMIVETVEPSTMKFRFMNLFNENVSKIFDIKSKEKQNSPEQIDKQFARIDSLIQDYISKKVAESNKSIKEEISSLNLGDEALENAEASSSAGSKYQQIVEYINSLYNFDEDEDSDCPNEISSQLASMYMYISSYGNGENNKYKDIKTEDDEYLYYNLVKEESQKIIEFWDRMIVEYNNCTMDNCMDEFLTLAHSFDDWAEWPLPNELDIDGKKYTHYLFENINDNDFGSSEDVSVGDYDFPEHIDFPEIPEDIEIDEAWAIDEMNKHEQLEPDDPNAKSFIKFGYWQKYFALASLICLVPIYWNCGLDILPWIQYIPLPCLFIAITSVHIPMFNLLIVFGIAIRGMYPWPIILYLNTSDQPISILTPLIAILEKLKNVFFAKLDQIEQMPIQSMVNMYIKKLNTEINEIKKENIKLDTYTTVIKNMNVPVANSVKEEFAHIVDPSIDTRQRITRIEKLSRKK